MEIINLKINIIKYRETKDKKILERLYIDFLTYIKNISRGIFNYEYKETDLTIKFIEVINNLNITENTNYEIQGKIVKSLENGKFDIIRKSINDKDKQPYYFEDVKLEIKDEKNVYSEVCLKDLLKHLSDKERLILNLSFFDDKTDIYISDILNISSARVGQIKKIALKKLRKEFIF